MSLLLATLLAALPPHYPVDHIVRGQKGECVTVFEGDTLETFSFEVKGLMKNFLGPGRDLVLVKLLGDKPTFTGVVSGMSGSPCSLDGKLLGALSYAFAMFAKEPIAGITPIEGMLEIMKLPQEDRPWRLEPGKQAAAGWPGGGDADWQAIHDGTALPDAHAETDIRPIATPLMMGGVPQAVRDHFAPWLRSVGFEPVAGGTSSAAKSAAPPAKLVPGGAISAVLIRGDADVAATGTVTYVDGNMVLAFGHPFFGAGAVSMPMAGADILNTMASAMRSFKMSATGPVIGELTQDRLTAIGGYMGAVPSMIPVSGSVKTPHGKSDFQIEVARDLVMSPRLVAMGLSSALAGRLDATERGTVRMDGEIRVQGEKPVVVHNVYAAQRDGGLMTFAALDIARSFAALWDTPFGPPPAMELRVQAEVSAEPIEEWIDNLYVDRAQSRPGDELQLAVRLRRLGGAPSLERFTLPVPRGWAGQEISIFAAGVEVAEKLTRDVNGAPRFSQFSQIGKYLGERRSDGHVYLLAVREGAGVHAAAEDLAFLPPSVVATMLGDSSKQTRGQGLAWEERRARPGVVAGLARVSVQVLPY